MYMKLVRLIVILLSLVALSSQVPAQTAAKKAPATSAKSAQDTSKLVDINSASASELKELPGIGDAYAAAIIKNRPYKNKSQLLSRKVLPPATYEKFKGKVIAKQ